MTGGGILFIGLLPTVADVLAGSHTFLTDVNVTNSLSDTMPPPPPLSQSQH